MAGSTHNSSHTRTTVVAIVGACVVLVLAGAGALHATASAAYTASLRQGMELQARYAKAYTASRLEPWNARFGARERLVAAWITADTLLSKGDYKDAVDLLSSTLGTTPAEPDLLALYHRAQETQTAETNRKAHLQHGHEGPGGTLTPTDIER